MTNLSTSSLVLLALLACRTQSFSSYDKNINEIDYRVKNGKQLQLKTTAPAREKLNLSQPEREKIITITSAPASYAQTIAPSRKPRYSVVQTGKQSTTREDTRDAIIDILIVVDESTSISIKTLQSVATTLSSELTKTLQGSDWKIAVTGSSKDGNYLATLSSKQSGNHAELLYGILVGAREQGTEHWNELVIDRAVKHINTMSWQRSGTADAQAVILITDEDLQCERNGLHTFFCEESGTRESERLSTQWKSKKSTRSAFGIINLAEWSCGDEHCKAENGVCSDNASATGRIKFNAPNCIYDKTKEKESYPCGVSVRSANPCYNRPDSHLIAKHNYLKTCKSGYNSCYKDRGSGILESDTGNSHLFDLIASINASSFDGIMKAIADKVKEKVLTTVIPGITFIDSILIGHKASKVQNLVVKIDGSALPKARYRVADYKITLNTTSQQDLQSLFPSGSTLSVAYDIAKTNRSFRLPQPQSPASKELVQDSVSVTVNSSPMDFSFNKSNGFITLNAVPPANARLAITADYMETEYELAQQLHRIDGGNTVCTKGNSTVSCAHNRGSLRFNQPNQLAVNDKITTTQLVDVLASNSEKLITLSERYVKESVQLKVSGKTCPADQLMFVGNVIDLANSPCSHLKNIMDADIVVDYHFYDDTSTFNLDVPDSVLAQDKWDVEVQVNSKILKAGEDYAIDQTKQTIHFLKMESIGHDSVATISYR